MAERPSSPSISASPDDAASHRRGSKAGSTRRRGTSDGDGPRSIGLNLILVVLVACVAAAGWFIANQHQLIEQERVQMLAAEARLAVLEDRLKLTDEVMSESESDTQETIGFWETEIRKLWAVTNERNRTWIKDNEKGLAKLAKTLDSLEKNNRELSTAVGRHDASFKQQQLIVDQLTGVEISIQQLANTQREIVDKVNSSSQTVASLQAGLGNRVTENEQAVTAIDAYRVQLNSRIANIERRLERLSNPAM